MYGANRTRLLLVLLMASLRLMFLRSSSWLLTHNKKQQRGLCDVVERPQLGTLVGMGTALSCVIGSHLSSFAVHDPIRDRMNLPKTRACFLCALSPKRFFSPPPKVLKFGSFPTEEVHLFQRLLWLTISRFRTEKKKRQ